MTDHATLSDGNDVGIGGHCGRPLVDQCTSATACPCGQEVAATLATEGTAQ